MKRCDSRDWVIANCRGEIIANGIDEEYAKYVVEELRELEPYEYWEAFPLNRTKIAKYKCKHCGQVVEIRSDKQWVRSYCEGTGKNVHLVKVSKNTDKGEKSRCV